MQRLRKKTTKVRIRMAAVKGKQSAKLTLQLSDLGGLCLRSTLQAGKSLLAGCIGG